MTVLGVPNCACPRTKAQLLLPQHSPVSEIIMRPSEQTREREFSQATGAEPKFPAAKAKASCPNTHTFLNTALSWGTFPGPAGHVRSPARTHCAKLAPSSPQRSAPTAPDRSGVLGAEPLARRPREKLSPYASPLRPANASSPCREPDPGLPSPSGTESLARPSQAGKQSPQGGPGEGPGTHAVSPSLGGLSAAGSRPLGVCECEPPIAQNLRPGCAPAAPPVLRARRAQPGPRAGRRRGGRRKGGAEGGREWRGAQPGVPAAREVRESRLPTFPPAAGSGLRTALGARRRDAEIRGPCPGCRSVPGSEGALGTEGSRWSGREGRGAALLFPLALDLQRPRREEARGPPRGWGVALPLQGSRTLEWVLWHTPCHPL